MDKIDRLLDAIENPDHYSESQLEDLLRDPEVKEIFDLLDKTTSSLRPIQTPDVDAEWQSFERAHKKHRFAWTGFFSRNIAASIAVGAVSLAAVAALVGVGVRHLNANSQQKEQTEVIDDMNVENLTDDALESEQPAPKVICPAPEVVIFDNETFESMINDIAGFYGYQVDFVDSAAKSLRLYFRWNQAASVENVIESLNNFEQINLSIKGQTIVID